MDNLRHDIYQNFDLALGFHTNCENYLLKLEEDEKTNPQLKEIPTEAIEEIFEDIFERCYLRDYEEVENLTTFNQFIEYTKHNFVFGSDEKGYYILFCATQGITFSKSSWNRFKKKYTLDDIDRKRLYALVENHMRPDDDFIKELNKLNFKWKKIRILNPVRIYSRFPQIGL